ncbi:MAG: histone deacetylase family protein [Thermoplasmatales archaeon]|nr:MAG: histone deacetylase family protein [Thermoplasmatales archaeon]
MIAIVYHEDYNKYDLGLSHPLIGDKPRQTMDFFKQKNIIKNVKVFEASKASEKDLLRVHNPRFLERVKKLSQTGGMLAPDTPAPIGIYEIACLVTGGTRIGGEKLFQGFKCVVNPLAGFHHASSSFSSGFCFFNDVAVVIEYLRKKYHLERFLIIDLDVHHANGTQEIYYDDPSVLNISFHQDGRTLYPGTGSLEEIGRYNGEGYTVNLPLPPGTGDKSYLKAFDTIIPPIIYQFNPQIIIYQSGVDTHHSDPLASLLLTYQTYYHLGWRIMELSKKTCNKLLVLFGGGYNSLASVRSYYNILCGILKKSDYIKEKNVFDYEVEKVDNEVALLKKILSQHWMF